MRRTFHRVFTSLAGAALLAGSVGCVGSVSGDATSGNGGGNSNTPGGGSNPGGGNGNTPGGGGNTNTPGGGANNPGGGGNQPSGSINSAGRTPMRRLTHAQFNNTVHDLLGIDGDFTSGFAIDEETAGFRANVTSPVSDGQVDKYAEVAEQLAGKAVAGGIDKLAPCAGKPEDKCAEDFINSFGKRAFRRPLTSEEVARLRTVFDAGKKADGNYAGGITLVLTAILQSPSFLYLPEFGSGAGSGNTPVNLGAYEIAARLSYFLNDSMPDAELFAAADGNKLGSVDEVAAQTRRLLGSARAKPVLAGFFRQWLESESVSSLEKDEKAYPAFNNELRTAMSAELDTYVTHVMSGSGPGADGRLASLLTGNSVFPNAALGTIYGVAGSGGRTDAPAGQRAGIFTLAGIMALYAHPDQTAPVSRGYLVSEKLLCVVPAPAPDDVVVMLPKPDPSKTTRERFAAHREAPQCAGCHALMDPYGLTFENYDAIGKWRDKDGVNAVDSTSMLPGLGMVKNAGEMMAKMSTAKEVASCMTKQWYRFALGRSESDVDSGSLASAEDAFRKSDFKLTDLIVGLTSTPAFRQRPPIR